MPILFIPEPPSLPSQFARQYGILRTAAQVSEASTEQSGLYRPRFLHDLGSCFWFLVPMTPSNNVKCRAICERGRPLRLQGLQVPGGQKVFDRFPRRPVRPRRADRTRLGRRAGRGLRGPPASADIIRRPVRSRQHGQPQRRCARLQLRQAVAQHGRPALPGRGRRAALGRGRDGGALRLKALGWGPI
jgi:hypothetical protein